MIARHQDFTVPTSTTWVISDPLLNGEWVIFYPEIRGQCSNIEESERVGNEYYIIASDNPT